MLNTPINTGHLHKVSLLCVHSHKENRYYLYLVFHFTAAKLLRSLLSTWYFDPNYLVLKVNFILTICL